MSPRGKKRYRRRIFRRLAVLSVLGAVVFGSFYLWYSGAFRTTVLPLSHVRTILDASERYQVDPYLALAVIKCESSFDERAVSRVGAQGLMQIMPATAQSIAQLKLVDTQKYRPDNMHDPATNIEYGIAYLAFLQRNLPEKDQVIAAYNAGIGNVQQWSKQSGDFKEHIAFKETKEYLRRVYEAYDLYKAAYSLVDLQKLAQS